jgi:hypothetical protein
MKRYDNGKRYLLGLSKVVAAGLVSGGKISGVAQERIAKQDSTAKNSSASSGRKKVYNFSRDDLYLPILPL